MCCINVPSFYPSLSLSFTQNYNTHTHHRWAPPSLPTLISTRTTPSSCSSKQRQQSHWLLHAHACEPIQVRHSPRMLLLFLLLVNQSSAQKENKRLLAILLLINNRLITSLLAAIACSRVVCRSCPCAESALDMWTQVLQHGISVAGLAHYLQVRSVLKTFEKSVIISNHKLASSLSDHMAYFCSFSLLVSGLR